VQPLALEPDLREEPAGRLSRGVLPHAARGREGERLGRLLVLEALLHLLLDLRLRTPVEVQARPHEHRARGHREGAIAEGAVARLEPAERAIAIEKVSAATEL